MAFRTLQNSGVQFFIQKLLLFSVSTAIKPSKPGSSIYQAPSFPYEEATEVTVQPVPLDASSWALLIRWQHNQAVIRPRSEAKEGYRRRKVNRVLPCAQGRI